MKKLILLVVLSFLISPYTLAHEVVEAENPFMNFLTPLWDFHDAVHWMVFVPFMATCYYFRYFYAKRRGHPKSCGLDEPKRKYKGDSYINNFHRYFFWLMLFFTLIHLSEVISKSQGLIEYKFSFLSPYIFPFTFEYEGPLTNIQTFGTIAEWLYVLVFLVFLFSCYFVRYFVGDKLCFCCSVSKTKRGISNLQDKLNAYHGHLFWLGLAAALLLLLSGGHL